MDTTLPNVKKTANVMKPCFSGSQRQKVPIKAKSQPMAKQAMNPLILVLQLQLIPSMICSEENTNAHQQPLIYEELWKLAKQIIAREGRKTTS